MVCVWTDQETTCCFFGLATRVSASRALCTAENYCVARNGASGVLEYMICKDGWMSIFFLSWSNSVSYTCIWTVYTLKVLALNGRKVCRLPAFSDCPVTWVLSKEESEPRFLRSVQLSFISGRVWMVATMAPEDLSSQVQRCHGACAYDVDRVKVESLLSSQLAPRDLSMSISQHRAKIPGHQLITDKSCMFHLIRNKCRSKDICC
jgi:hypothetical protein